MKHKTIDLTAEVKRATLPDGLQGFLFPMYEAISNALHSIEDRWENDLEDKGRLDVTFDDQAREVTIKDNGSGFDEANLSAFLTPLTGNKYERGGKGFGRFKTIMKLGVERRALRQREKVVGSSLHYTTNKTEQRGSKTH